MTTNTIDGLGRRQLLFLSWMAAHDNEGITFQTPWGPVEDERVRRSLVRRGALVATPRSSASGNVTSYVLTEAGRATGRAQWENLRDFEWTGEAGQLQFDWEVDTESFERGLVLSQTIR